MGSPPATFTCIAVPVVMLTLSLRSLRQHYHGLLRVPPSGRLVSMRMMSCRHSHPNDESLSNTRVKSMRLIS